MKNAGETGGIAALGGQALRNVVNDKNFLFKI